MSVINDLLDTYVKVETVKSQEGLAATAQQQKAGLNSVPQNNNVQAQQPTSRGFHIPKWGYVAGAVATVLLLVVLVKK